MNRLTREIILNQLDWFSVRTNKMFRLKSCNKKLYIARSRMNLKLKYHDIGKTDRLTIDTMQAII